MRNAPVALLVLLILVGCGRETPRPPLVVFASGEAGSALDGLFKEFTTESSIPVTAIWGDSTENTNRLISGTVDTVDVLITTNVADIWRAAEEGVLRPIAAATLKDVAAVLRDPDGFWAAVEIRVHVIVHANGQVRPLINSYDTLASRELRGRVCLSSAGLHVNRSLLAMLIDERGVKSVERMVRLWMQNLAEPPFSGQDGLTAALRDGRCDYGVMEWHPSEDDLYYFKPLPPSVDIDAIGIARHTRRPDSAQQFAAWILRKTNARTAENSEMRFVGIAGWRDEDARLLAERAGYR